MLSNSGYCRNHLKTASLCCIFHLYEHSAQNRLYMAANDTFVVEILMQIIGHYAAAQIFRTQLIFDEPFILEQNRFFYEELIATASEYMQDYHIQGAPQALVEELLRISRGNIYD